MFKGSIARLLSLIALSASVISAQSALPRKDIPAIAKAANGAIVTIITAANDKPIAQGTGFLVSADGVIVTNYHVIETGNVAIVKFPDDTAFPVDGVLAADKVRDLAIIKIHGKTFRTLALGDSDDIQVGEEVVAIGNPLSLESTVSNGIISGVRTSKEQGGKFLQTTAPISPGSSGGPLFNMSGEVVGINTMYLEGGENLNFAIPVNDAKLLLSHQSAKLQNLPNEHMSALTDAPPSTTGEEGIARKEQTKGPYYVRERRNETYVIVYRGHQLTAQCREALSWDDGTDKLGRPLTEHECKYMPYAVGEHIAEDKILRQNNELRYLPFAETSGHVADILDITDDVPVGARKQPRPLPKTSPEIQKTLHWIQNTLDDGEGKTFYMLEDGRSETRTNLMPEATGCRVTFVEETKVDHEITNRLRVQTNLGDLDPSSLGSNVVSSDILGPQSMVFVHTTDKASSVGLALSDRRWKPSIETPTAGLQWVLPSPYAERFVKALKHAITLCGGKTSTF
jgi:Trypsin-like peptidase domain